MGWADSVAASTKRSGQAQGFITIGLYEFYDGFRFMRWVTSEDVPRSGELRVPAGAIFTPSARELAEVRAIRIIEMPAGQAAPAAPPEKTIALGADHGGFHLKETLKPLLATMRLEVRDVGVYDEKPVDSIGRASCRER